MLQGDPILTSKPNAYDVIRPPDVCRKALSFADELSFLPGLGCLRPREAAHQCIPHAGSVVFLLVHGDS